MKKLSLLLLGVAVAMLTACGGEETSSVASLPGDFSSSVSSQSSASSDSISAPSSSDVAVSVPASDSSSSSKPSAVSSSSAPKPPAAHSETSEPVVPPAPTPDPAPTPPPAPDPAPAPQPDPPAPTVDAAALIADAHAYASTRNLGVNGDLNLGNAGYDNPVDTSVLSADSCRSDLYYCIDNIAALLGETDQDHPPVYNIVQDGSKIYVLYG